MKIIIDMWNWLISNSNALMVILTGFTLIASIIIQIRLEKQRNEDIRARLHVSLINDDLHTYLCLSNIGKQNAWNIQIHINEDIIGILPTHLKNKEYLRILNEQSTAIKPGEKVYYLLGSIHVLKNLCNEKEMTIKISGKYCNAYKLKDKISINEFLNHPPYKLFFKNKSN
ncbi:MAG: hypothetical protein HDS46_06815 [Bacteroides sp.]|nr:hypothetical protein [Bacteroides sp.]